MQTLIRFWHWADNEKPSDTVLRDKAGARGPLSEEAQEAIDKAADVLCLRLPGSSTCPAYAPEARHSLKLLSLAILEAWEMLPKTNTHLPGVYLEKLAMMPNIQGRVEFLTIGLPRPVWKPMAMDEAQAALAVAPRNPIKDDPLSRPQMALSEDQYRACVEFFEKETADLSIHVGFTVDQATGSIMFYSKRLPAVTEVLDGAYYLSGVQARDACRRVIEAVEEYHPASDPEIKVLAVGLNSTRPYMNVKRSLLTRLRSDFAEWAGMAHDPSHYQSDEAELFIGEMSPAAWPTNLRVTGLLESIKCALKTGPCGICGGTAPIARGKCAGCERHSVR